MEMAEEKQAMDEAMAEQEPNNELKQQIEQKRRTNYKNLTDNLIKSIQGVADADLLQFEAPVENRGNEMSDNVQQQNIETEQVALANDIHESSEP